MDKTKGVALVTGASAGIGAEFARQLARKGYGLILVARRRDRLEALAQELGGAEVLQADLVEDAGLQRVAERIQAEPNLRLLVNNAGIGTRGRFYEADLEAQERMHRLHVLAPVRLTHAALRVMVAQGEGAVINVSSVAAFGVMPGSVSYSATKTWMNRFTEGLAMELRSAGSRVQVQALCPGFTITEFHDVAAIDRNRIPAKLWMRAEDIVEASLKGLERGDIVVIPGTGYKLLAWLMARTPAALRMAAAVRLGRKAGRV